MGRMSRGLIVMAVTLTMLLPLAVSAQTAPTYSTDSVTASAIAQTSIGGYGGVLVNYTSSFSTQFSSFIYIDVMNSAGQTVYWNVGACSFAPNQKVACFVGISSSLSSGNYTAVTFATTSTGVAVSSSSTFSLVV